MGLIPCDACGSGWGTYSVGTDGASKSRTCRDECEYWKRFIDGPMARKVKEIAKKCGSKKS